MAAIRRQSLPSFSLMSRIRLSNGEMTQSRSLANAFVPTLFGAGSRTGDGSVTGVPVWALKP